MSKLVRPFAFAALAAAAAVSSRAAYADIVPDGNLADWASVPSVALDFNNAPGGGLDILDVKIANNGTNLFALVTFATAVNPNNPDLAGTGSTLYFGIDKDQSTGSGFNVFGVNRVGIEAAWRNDEGIDVNGGNLSQGAAISPYGTATITQEISVSLTSLLADGSTPVFGATGSTFRFVFYTSGNGFHSTEGNPVFDEMVVGNYTISGAPIPEPSSFAAIAGLGVLGLAALRRRR